MTAYLTTRELASRWRTTQQSLRLHRHRRRGVPFVKLGKLVRYRLVDVVAWEKANRVKPERQA